MSINIFGVVGEDVRASDILAKLQAEKGDSIEVNIMSPGGSVIEGMAIYDALRNSGKKIITRALGQAASIASIIFMAGDEREVGDNAEIMIHNAMVFAGGNKHELSSFIDRLDGIDTKLINIYATRTNLNEDQVRALLDNETFMDADEAVEKGFATCKADALAMVAQYNSTNQEKEPVLMAEDKTKAGFFAHMKAYFTNEEEEEEVKAEGDNVPEEEVDSAKAEDEDMPEKEVPEAMEEEPKPEDMEEDPDMEALKAELEETKKELAEAKAEAESKPKAVKEEAEAKAGLVFDAMTDNKITMHEAKNLVAKNLSDVEATLKEKEANATGRGKSETPKDEPKLSIYDQYQNISDAGERSTFFKAHKTEIINQSKES